MLDIAWPELIVIGAVALVAIGPKDLPKVMRVMGRLVGKARGMAQDVRLNFEQLSYEAEIAESLNKKETTRPAVPPAESAKRDDTAPPAP